MCQTIKSISAYNLIRELIFKGELLPGTRLVLADLEKKLHVGRGPIREALMRLDRSGIIQNIPYKGAIVSTLPSFNEIKCIYDMRVEIECTLSLFAMKLATEKDFQYLEEKLSEFENPNIDNSLYFNPDREFHSAIHGMAQMPHLKMMASNMVDHIEIFLNNRFYVKEDQDILLEQHKKIINSMVKKDEYTLKETMKQNILMGLALIQNEMKIMGRKIE